MRLALSNLLVHSLTQYFFITGILLWSTMTFTHSLPDAVFCYLLALPISLAKVQLFPIYNSNKQSGCECAKQQFTCDPFGNSIQFNTDYMYDESWPDAKMDILSSRRAKRITQGGMWLQHPLHVWRLAVIITINLRSPMRAEWSISWISAMQVWVDGRAALIVRRIYRGTKNSCMKWRPIWRKHRKKVKNKTREGKTYFVLERGWVVVIRTVSMS